MTTTSEISLKEALRTQRSTRHFSNKPIPDDVLKTILRAATWAPTAGNRQPWRFVVVDDPAIKRQIGELYDLGSATAYGAQGATDREPTFSEAPANVLVCIDPVSTNSGPGSEFF